jgi:hypothetical protein
MRSDDQRGVDVSEALTGIVADQFQASTYPSVEDLGCEGFRQAQGLVRLLFQAMNERSDFHTILRGSWVRAPGLSAASRALPGPSRLARCGHLGRRAGEPCEGGVPENPAGDARPGAKPDELAAPLVGVPPDFA